MTDTLGSDDYPVAEMVGEKGAAQVLSEVASRDLVFDGTNPLFIKDVLDEDEVSAPLVARAELVTPWVWDIGPEMQYLVYAIQIERSLMSV